MRLNTKAFALTCGIFWGLTIFLATVWLLIFGFQGQVMSNLDHFYFGYSFSYVGAVIGAIAVARRFRISNFEFRISNLAPNYLGVLGENG